MKGQVLKVSGPVVFTDVDGAVNDLVHVGEHKLLGEIIELRKESTVVQVYEDTTGVGPGDTVKNTGRPLSVALAPGLLGQVFDGTQRPLDIIRDAHGAYLPKGVEVPPLDIKKTWAFKPTVKKGDSVSSGMVIGEVPETSLITHKILCPPGVEGKIESIETGSFKISDPIAKIGGTEVSMLQYWPVRRARPYSERSGLSEPLLSGQRVLDFMYPVTKGGVAAIPGPFGAGKTVTQQQLARWCDAEVIVYIGCGERGNEMTEVLEEFPGLKDPKTGNPLMDRTILIANTSNMPVAAREASVYTGITIAEYYRDQGYNVALMADSTSRWAEAMREISGRLEEMPGEEGYPAYLSKRLAEFYERAGSVKTLNNEDASITVVGAVSPAGGDFSEPVTQATLRMAKCFWALDSSLADKRHFPSINWLKSYSLYTPTTDAWFDSNCDPDWSSVRSWMTKLLQEESELMEIVQIVGSDTLPAKDRATLFIARMIREDFLQQNAFHENDTFCPNSKMRVMMRSLKQVGDLLYKSCDQIDWAALRQSEACTTFAQLKYESNEGYASDNVDKHVDTFTKLFQKSIDSVRRKE